MRKPALTTYVAAALLALMPVLAPVLAHAAGPDAKEPGGSGRMQSDLLSTRCFVPRPGVVTEVCADYTISWKLFALMGEPVGNYTVRWTLKSISLMDPQRKSKVTYESFNVPAELQKPVDSIELYLDGYATVVDGPGTNGVDRGMRHAFNTGVAARAGNTSSFNVPGSPNWDKIFERGSLPCDSSGGVLGGIYTGQHSFVDAKEAKARFAAGLGLSDFKTCKTSALYNTDNVDSAVAKLCEKKGADAKYPFCPKQKEEPKPEPRKEPAANASSDPGRKPPGVGASVLDGGASGNAGSGINSARMLDAASERPTILRRLESEKAAFRRSAEPVCNKVMGDIDACYGRTGCARPAASPSVERCLAIPRYPEYFPPLLTRTYKLKPGELCYEEDAACRESRAAHAREQEKEAQERRAEQRAWKDNYSDLTAQCAARGKERAAFDSCQRSFAATCNPRGFADTDQCLDDQQRVRGPSESDARRLVEKEWAERARTGSSITHSILD